MSIHNSSNEFWRETLQALADHGPIAARDCVEHVTIATEPEQVVSLIGKFVRRKGFAKVHDEEERPRRYTITETGLAKLDELAPGTVFKDEGEEQQDPIKRSEQRLVKRVAELEPAEPWEFDPEHDAVVRDLAALRFSPDTQLYREGRERAGRLRYLAQRLENVATVEAQNVAADLRETAGLIDKLTEVVA